MTYSCTDFADDVFAELDRVGAIYESEAADENLEDNASLQADYALAGIARLVEVKEALEQYRQAIEDFAASKGVSLQDGVVCEADDRVSKALAAIERRGPQSISGATNELDAAERGPQDPRFEKPWKYGYRVEQGDPSDGPELEGKWWWTLSGEGWSGIEASPGEFSTEEEAWLDALCAYQEEMQNH